MKRRRPRACRLTRSRPLARMDAARRSRDLRLRPPRPSRALVRLVGQACRFDDLIADLIHELRGRPYDLVHVAGGYALRTKTRFAPAIRAAHPGRGGDDIAELTRTESLPNRHRLSAAGDAGGDFQAGGARDQPRRDRRPQALRLIDGAIRAPQPGARSPMSPRGNSWRRSGSPPCAICPTSNGSRPKVCWKEGRGTPSSTTPSVL